jgi:hypothetical protein
VAKLWVVEWDPSLGSPGLGAATLVQLDAAWNGSGSAAGHAPSLSGPMLLTAAVPAWGLAVVAHRWLNDDQVGHLFEANRTSRVSGGR